MGEGLTSLSIECVFICRTIILVVMPLWCRVLEDLQGRMKVGVEMLAEHILCRLYATCCLVWSYKCMFGFRHKEASDQKLCVVCLEHSSTHVLVPCGHQCLCQKCALNIAPGLCPMCREPSIMAIMVYEN